jgi:FtsH-binding integral membrane protein
MSGWESTINTGNPEMDRYTVEQYRQTAAAQGMTLGVQPLPTGGFHVRAMPAGAPQAAPGYGAPPQQAGWGAQPQYGAQGMGAQAPYGAPQGMGAQAPYGAPQGMGAQPQYGAPQGMGAQAPYGAPQGGGYGAPAQAGFGGVGPQAAAAAGGVLVGAGTGAPAMTNDRIAYLRKVYGLLTLSAGVAILTGFLSITLGGTTKYTAVASNGKRAAVMVPALVAAMLHSPGLMYGAFGLLFVATLGASAVSKVKGLNFVALMVVAVLMGVELAPMVFVAQVFAGLGDTLSASPVRDTFAMVGAIFVGITGYAFVTKKDFSYMKAMLSMGFWVIFAACMLAVVVHSEVFSLAVASAGAVLAAGFLLYNTGRILRSSAMDDPVGDALGLIVQLRNLFMFILRILMSSRR